MLESNKEEKKKPKSKEVGLATCMSATAPPVLEPFNATPATRCATGVRDLASGGGRCVYFGKLRRGELSAVEFGGALKPQALGFVVQTGTPDICWRAATGGWGASFSLPPSEGTPSVSSSSSSL